ncbi:MAG: hypothetical protein AAGJ81_02840 [Verrucomicrobiota bacterium]
MNRPNPLTLEPLDDASLRGLLFLSCFGCLIAAKCAISEALRLYYGFAINSALFIWLPSLVIGGAVCLLYIAGPGSSFHAYWKSKQFLIPAALIWLTIAFSVVRQVPSVLVPGVICLVAAAAAFVLGRIRNSIAVSFLAAFWAFGAALSFFYPPVGSYSIFAILLVLFGSIPCGIGYFHLKAP